MLTVFEKIHLINNVNQFSTNISTTGDHQLLFIDLFWYNAVFLNTLDNWNLYSWEKIKIIVIAYYLKFFFSMYPYSLYTVIWFMKTFIWGHHADLNIFISWAISLFLQSCKGRICVMLLYLKWKLLQSSKSSLKYGKSLMSMITFTSQRNILFK